MYVNDILKDVRDVSGWYLDVYLDLGVNTSPKTKDMKELEENVKNSLDVVPVVQTQQ